MTVGVPDVSLGGMLLPDQYFVGKHFDAATNLQFLGSLRAWVYSEKLYLSYGDQLQDAYVLAPKDWCRGALESLRPIRDAIQRGARVTGWAWDRARNQPVSEIVIVTPDGLISGLARGNGYGLPHKNSVPHPESSIFRGFLQGLPQPAPVRAYAIVDSGRAACPLDVADSVPTEFSSRNLSSMAAPAKPGTP